MLISPSEPSLNIPSEESTQRKNIWLLATYWPKLWPHRNVWRWRWFYSFHSEKCARVRNCNVAKWFKMCRIYKILQTFKTKKSRVAAGKHDVMWFILKPRNYCSTNQLIKLCSLKTNQLQSQRSTDKLVHVDGNLQPKSGRKKRTSSQSGNVFVTTHRGV